MGSFAGTLPFTHIGDDGSVREEGGGADKEGQTALLLLLLFCMGVAGEDGDVS